MSRGIEKALAECLEKIERGEATIEEALCAYPDLRAELEPLIGLAWEMRSAPKVMAPENLRTTRRPVFVRGVRPEPTGIGAWLGRWLAPLPAFGWSAPLARVAAGFAAALLLLGGTMVASAGSLPEEPLHPVKLALESAQLALVPSPQARAGLELRFAARRLEEVESAARQGRTTAVEQGLALYEQRVESAIKSAEESPQAPEGEADKALLDSLRQNQEVLSRVYNQVPTQAQPAILHAMEVSQRHATQPNEGGAEAGSPSRPQPKVGATTPPGQAKAPSSPSSVEPAGERQPPGQLKDRATATPRGVESARKEGNSKESSEETDRGTNNQDVGRRGDAGTGGQPSPTAAPDSSPTTRAPEASGQHPVPVRAGLPTTWVPPGAAKALGTPQSAVAPGRDRDRTGRDAGPSATPDATGFAPLRPATATEQPGREEKETRHPTGRSEPSETATPRSTSPPTTRGPSPPPREQEDRQGQGDGQPDRSARSHDATSESPHSKPSPKPTDDEDRRDADPTRTSKPRRNR